MTKISNQYSLTNILTADLTILENKSENDTLKEILQRNNIQ
jgi:hypothetical protein